MPSTAPEVDRLRDRIEQLGPAAARRLGRRVRSARPQALPDLSRQVEQAEEMLARRRAAVPHIDYPAELPVSARTADLAAAIEANQVVIVAGETGSGKSTQLPKICLALGRGVRGMIGHTQPRRIAARALAERIAAETRTELGQAVGYSIRFGDHTSATTLLKLMTDGILLAEIHRDPDLLAYDTIIIDEAHERSLNIDFLLGYLTRLLPRRPDLKVVITSATIDPLRFSRHFGDAPVVEVSGRTFPVEIRYRPWGPLEDAEDDETGGTGGRPETDQGQAICSAVDELCAAGDGDILVFLSGEREITDTADILRGHLAGRPRPPEILPLYGRLSAADQHRVFDAHAGRRIVLSTNVAETSLTVPGIRYVVDPGTARISRYSVRTKVQRLPIEPISRASAGQRAGRCGRVADGICIRLYSEIDFAARDEFTDPEIARTALASVILQMASLGLGDIGEFPFLDPPDRRQIADGITVLKELGALTAEEKLTPVGRSLAALPIDPRLARIVVEGAARGVLDETLVIAAALSIQDVREYPLDDRDRATAAHSRFVDPASDLMSLLHLWRYLRQSGKDLSGNAFRRMCRSEYLHYLRIREWQDLHGQLRQLARGLDRNATAVDGAAASAPEATGKPAAQQGRGSLATHPFDGVAIHTAVLAGLLSHIGARSEAGRDYQGTRGTTFWVWPGSALARSGAPLVVVAELVETSRLFGRIAAAVQPEWVESVGGELLRRNYSEPRWSKRRAAAVATEKVSLLGVTLVAARTVTFSRIDPELCRELFIRHALIEGEWETRHAFLAANHRTAERVSAREDRLRRRDLLIDDQELFGLYDARIPAAVVSGRHFDSWWRKTSREHPDLLTFTEDELTVRDAAAPAAAQFPDRVRAGGAELAVDYAYRPGDAADGATITIPLAVLARLDPRSFSADIPGWRTDVVVALLRSLPKTLRRNFVPAADFAVAALSGVAEQTPFGPAELAARLVALTGIRVTAADFDLDRVPDHLRPRFRVVDESGAAVATGKDLTALRAGLSAASRDEVARVSGAVERTGLRAFPTAGFSRRVDATVHGQQVTGYPALVVEADPGTVGIRVFTSEADQARAMRAGTRRLLALTAASAAAQVRRGLSRAEQLTLAGTPHGSMAGLVADATEAAVDALLDWAGGPTWDAAAFGTLADRIAGQLPRAVLEIMIAVADALTAAHAAGAAIDAVAQSSAGPGLVDQVSELRAELADLLRPGFVTATRAGHLPDLARWLQALTVRAQRIRESPDRDRVKMAEVAGFAAEIATLTAALGAQRSADPDVAAVVRLLREFRVATFAQPMRTAVPVSAKRLTAAVVNLRN